MPPVSHVKKKPGQAGFTLFEMVVVICTIAILYFVAEQRINELPAAAERASFNGLLAQIKNGVKFEVYSKLASGGKSELLRMVSTNPMEYMVETPSNYLGEMATVTDAVRRRNAWYFETGTGELVYVVGGNSIDDVLVTIAGIPVNLGQIRFRIAPVYSNGGDDADPEDEDSWEGVLLQPVNDYSWPGNERDGALAGMGEQQ